jgi:tRNA G10  N-methylase Trm11
VFGIVANLANFPIGTTEHPVNKNKRRKILVSIWDFGTVHPQLERSHYTCNNHPAKMRPTLARAILQIYGESPVLDPMAGIGTTLVEAMLLGMNAVGIEYEQKFVDQANKNVEHIQKNNPGKKLGKAVCIKGDARYLQAPLTVCSVLLSPPYFDALSTNHGKLNHFAIKKNLPIYYSHDKQNIGNIPKFGSIVFSPPYGDSHRGGGINKRIRTGKLSERDKLSKVSTKNRYPCSRDPGNIDNVPRFGSILFSPPYMSSRPFQDQNFVIKDVKNERPVSEIQSAIGYSGPENLGNREGITYLGGMAKVYSECFKVLKPGKFMVVVVKDIRRNGLLVPLAADTIKLCQAVGFELFELIVNKLYHPSFWVLHNAKKVQSKGIPQAMHNHEYVLCFRKPPCSFREKNQIVIL